MPDRPEKSNLNEGYLIGVCNVHDLNSPQMLLLFLCALLFICLVWLYHIYSWWQQKHAITISHVSLELRDAYYTQTGTTASCDLTRSPDQPFPRRWVCFEGVPFSVDCATRSGDHRQNRRSLSSVYIPSSVESLSTEYLRGYSARYNVAFAMGSKLSHLEGSVFVQCSSLASICIPSSVAFLGEKCFADCRSLATVNCERGSKLSRIGQAAFRDCSSLASISLPSPVEVLDRDSFASCRCLFAVDLGSSSKLSRIDDNAFRGCLSLRALCLPATVQFVSPSALPCRTMHEFAIHPDNPFFEVLGYCLTNRADRSLVCYFGDGPRAVIPAGLNRLSRRCLAGNEGILLVAFGANSAISCLETSAFAGCQSLTSICIPRSVQIVDEKCFVLCTRL
jgi:hypothetical protein